MKLISKPLIAIYDENELQRQLLHNVLEHNGYSVAFSCMESEELFLNLKNKPDALLVNCDVMETIIKCIKKVRKECGKMKIIVFTKLNDSSLYRSLIKAGANSVIMKCNFKSLITELDKFLLTSSPAQNEMPKALVNISESNPFYSIVKNEKYFSILKCLEKGYSAKDISPVVELGVTTVESYIKKMTHEVHCRNRTELVGKAKDAKVI